MKLVLAATACICVVALAACSGPTSGKSSEPVAQKGQPEAPQAQQSNDFVYATYTSSLDDQYADSGKPYAIFWASKTCATCGKKDGEIKDRLSSLPEGTAILRAEFGDMSDEMKEKYGIVKYDTFTVFDGKGGFESIRGASVDEVTDLLEL